MEDFKVSGGDSCRDIFQCVRRSGRPLARFGRCVWKSTALYQFVATRRLKRPR